MLTIYPDFTIIECDHPDCRRQVLSHSAGRCRALAREQGWKEKPRWGHIDDWHICEEHLSFMLPPCLNATKYTLYEFPQKHCC